MAHLHGLEGSHDVRQSASQEFPIFLPSGKLNFLEPPLNFLHDKVLSEPIIYLTPKYFENHLNALIRLLSPAPPGSPRSSPPHSLFMTSDVGPKTPPLYSGSGDTQLPSIRKLFLYVDLIIWLHIIQR